MATFHTFPRVRILMSTMNRITRFFNLNGICHDTNRSAEVSYFDSIIRRRGFSFGVLVAANGITGDHIDQTEAQRILAAALAEQRQIVVVILPEIHAFKNTNQVVKLFKEKLCDLAVYGGLPL